MSRPNMPENARMQEIVRNAVAQVLERQLVSLRETVVQEVLRELQPALGGKAQGGSNSAALQKAVSAIQAGTTQKEILRALLDNMFLYSGRAALFVIKNGSASGWQGTSFSNNEAIKDLSWDIRPGLAARVIQSRSAETGTASEMDRHFISTFGAPEDDRVVLLPLLLKDKVSAIVFADAGRAGGTLDPAALEV